MNLWNMLWQMGPVATLVLLLLMGLSVVSWTIILAKMRVLRQAEIACQRFRQLFWQTDKLQHLQQRAQREERTCGVARLCQVGCQELNRLQNQDLASTHLFFQGTARLHSTLQQAQMIEMNRLQSHIPTLATIGSTAPFIGLFGTVLGMIHAFGQIGLQGQAHLTAVAPGIAEALIATAAGLFAAIPATAGYNALHSRLVRIQHHVHDLMEDFVALAKHPQGAKYPDGTRHPAGVRHPDGEQSTR
ncbi:MAG: MotA/TolQ/ExbB proton channel family protein [Myxococcota bacterium]